MEKNLVSLIKKELRKVANPKKAKDLARFFKTGKGEYGEGDKFLGVVVPEQRRIVKSFTKDGLSLAMRSRTSSEPEVRLRSAETLKLLQSSFHEERLTALLILVNLYQRGDQLLKKKIFNFYLKNLKHVNNWDLVDLSAPNIIGDYLFHYYSPQKEVKKSRGELVESVLLKLAKSKNIWSRRVAVLATFTFIKNKQFKESLELAEFLLIEKKDQHDLIHKAVGWMLREVGKRESFDELRSGKKVLINFLNKFSSRLPRTALRYAIEKLTPLERQKYML